jgi:alpha-tubulin suppressor-like RCC1 family protein
MVGFCVYYQSILEFKGAKMKIRIWGKSLIILAISAIVFGAIGGALPPDAAFAQDTWSTMPSGTSNKLLGVWGSGSNDVFAVGNGGTIQHFNGTEWEGMTSGTEATLYDVWGSSPTNIYAVGAFTILHYNGIVWDEWSETLLPVIGDPTSSYPLLLSVWGSGPNDVFFVGAGGTVLHYSPWYGGIVALHEIDSGTEYDLNDVWGSGPDDVFAVGSAGTILHYYPSIISVIDGTPVYGYSFHTMDSGIEETLLSVWGSGPNDVFAVGEGIILHYDGITWSEMPGTSNTFLGVWGSSPDDVFAVGWESAILHYNGTAWSEMATDTANDLTDVWGSGPNEVFAVGYGGTILHYTATLSTDATLSSLVLSSGTLDPVFAPGTTGYTASVANSVDSITVTPTVNESHATVTVGGSPVSSGQASPTLPLNVGTSVITIAVTAQDGTTTRTYTVTVTRLPAASSDTSLSNLTISSGTLDPVFAPGTTSYTASVANSVASITVTPMVNESHATVTVGGSPVSSGQPSQAIPLNVGVSTITIVITAQDGVTTMTYTVTMTREPSSGIAITTTSLQDGVVGIAYSQTLEVTGGTSPYTWYIDSGAIPVGLSLDSSTGTITGMPELAGTSSLTVIVTDSADITDTQALSIKIYPALAPISGTPWGWGLNSNGQLGNGTTTNSNTPIQVSSLTEAVAVSAGGSHSLALKSDGTVWAWGLNSNGQLGNNTTTTSNIPVQASGLTDVIAVSAGDAFSLALKSDGTVWAWGLNSNGQLGNSTTTDSHIPIQVNGLSGAVAISTGSAYGLALKSDGTVWGWGYNDKGQLGNGTTAESHIPVQVSSLTNIIVIAAGSAHSLAIKSGGTAWAWGNNSNGQLGNGNTTNSYTPVQVNGLTGVVAIAAGAYHSLGVESDGTAWAWGYNGEGRLGNGTTTESHTPVQVSGLTGVTVIFAGYQHSLIVKSDSTAWAWGGNSNGQLGNSTTANSYTPVQVNGLTGVVNIDAGGYHSLAISSIILSSDASLSSLTISSGPLSPVFAPGTTGYTASVANSTTNVTVTPTVNESHATVTVDGQPVSSGQASPTLPLNVGTSVITIAVTAQDGTTTRTYTVTVTRLPAASSDASLSNLTISAGTLDPVFAPSTTGYTASVANSTTNVTVTPTVNESHATVTVDGQPVSSGQASPTLPLNVGTSVITIAVTAQDGTTTRTYTITVTRLPPSAIAITTAVLPDGIVSNLYLQTLVASGGSSPYTWSITAGNLPAGLLLGASNGAITGTSAAAGPYYFTVTVTDSYGSTASKDLKIKINGLETPWAWGNNDYGQMGNGTRDSSSTPARVSLTGVVVVSAGGVHSLALKSDGTVWACGINSYGQLGDGTNIDRTTPVQAGGLVGVVDIAAGYSHSLALKSDGTVWAWGYNYYGQLGDGTNTSSNTPVQVSGLTEIVAVAAGDSHSLALRFDGSVWAWGSNSDGQLGDGTTASRNTPVQVDGLAGAVAVSAGSYHSLALKSDGTIWAWGDNVYGQLGNDTTTDSSIPVQVNGLTGAAAIDAGQYHNLAVGSDATVWAWGDNNYGQLGDGTKTSSNTPVQVSGLNGMTAVSAGKSYSLGLRYNGVFWAWGYNYYGQLGDGTNTSSNTPVQVSGLNAVTAIDAGSYHSLALSNAPFITTTSLPAGEVGTAYSQTLAAAGGIPPYTWTIASGTLPDGLSLDAATGTIAGTPTTAGIYNFTIMVADTIGGASTKTFIYRFSNDPPVASDQSVTTDEDLVTAIALSATDPNGDALTYSIVTPVSHGILGGTPPNLVYTPAPGYTGPDSFTFKANDGKLDSNLAIVIINVTGVIDEFTLDPTGDDPGAGTWHWEHSVAISGDTAIWGAPDRCAYVFVRSGNTWSQQARLTPSDGQNNYFGCSVAISGDTAVVGAHGDYEYPGAVYVFVRSGNTWSQQAKLTRSDGEVTRFGYSVAIEGDTVVAGDLGYRDTEHGIEGLGGSAFVFVRSGTIWSQQDELVNTRYNWGYNGYSVAISGDTIVVGAPYDNYMLAGGAVDVFVREGAEWTHEEAIFSWDREYDTFGYSVAIDGDTMVVGAIQERRDLYHTLTGAAYIYTRSGTTWSQQAKLTADDSRFGDRFGCSVSISGDTVLVGAEYYDMVFTADRFTYNSGSAYVFARAGTTWSQQAKLVTRNDGQGMRFGYSVAIDGDTALVGCYWGSPSVYRAAPVNSPPIASDQSVLATENTAGLITLTATDVDGEVLSYSIVTPPAHGTLSGTLPEVTYTPALNYTGPDSFTFKANDGKIDSNVASVSIIIIAGIIDEFTLEPTGNDPGAGNWHWEHSVAISGDTAIWGAPDRCAYVFVRSGNTWSQQARLTPSDGQNNYFGCSVAISGDTAVVGAHGDYEYPGAVYVFVRSGNTWSQQAKLTRSDGEVTRFGYSVAIEGDTVVAGDLGYRDTEHGIEGLGGSAFVFVRSGTIWSQQDELVNTRYNWGYNGYSVAISGDTIVVGAPYDNYMLAGGAVDVFVREGAEWTHEEAIFSWDREYDTFGYSVAIDGDTMVVGAIQERRDLYHTLTGAAYIYTRSGTTWSQQAKLTADDSRFGDRFGCSVSISGDTVLVGAEYYDMVFTADRFTYNSGSAYVFARAGTTWSQQAKLVTRNDGQGMRFGYSVAIDGDTALVGCYWGSPSVYRAAPVNSPPIASDQSVLATENTAGLITLTATDVDGEVLSYSIVTPPAHGTLSGTLPEVTYTPALNYTGPDSFTFKANDGKIDSNVASVSIIILNSPAGHEIVVRPTDPATQTTPVTLTFSTVDQSGITTLLVSSTGPDSPAGFIPISSIYEITTTAVFSGNIMVCITYDPSGVTNEDKLKLFHYENGQWVDVTTSLDIINHIICGRVTSFSPFSIFEPDAQGLKSSTIHRLEKAKTGDKKQDANINRAIQLINNSLEQKLWVDPSHLVYGPKADWLREMMDRFDRDKKTVDDKDIDDDSRIGRQSPPGARNGITVFHQEMAAVSLMQTDIQKYEKEIPKLEKQIASKESKRQDASREKAELNAMNEALSVFKDVIDDLVTADMMLAKIAITDAKNKTVVNPAMSKIVSKEIESAEKEFTLAIDAANKGQSAMAVTRFSHAWLHAQLAMRFATFELPQPSPKTGPKDNGDRDRDKKK